MNAEAASLNNNPVDGIEILVSLAKSGKIDPWNIDIGEVTDRYLEALSELKSHDLKLTGKTLLYAAILLRMKSDSLAGINFLELPSDELSPDEDGDFLELGLTSVPSPLETLSKAFHSLDAFIRRRTSVKQPRTRKVTLDDLIQELRKYEELEKMRRLKESVEKADRRRVQNFEHLSSEEIVELAHDEFIEDTILRLKDLLEQLFFDDKPVTLTQLEKEGKLDRISAFIALLFLSANGDIDLYQESFYTELYVEREQPTSSIEATIA